MRVAFAEIDQDVSREMQPGHHGVGSCTSPREAVWSQRESYRTDSRCLLTGIGLLFSPPAWNMPVELPRQVLADFAVTHGGTRPHG